VGDRGRPLSGSEAPARRRKAGDGATLDWPRDGNEAVAAVAQSFEPAVARLHHSRNREAEQARQLHDVLDSTSAAIIAIDADGRIEHANRAADRRFGAAQDALIGTSVETLMRPGTRPPHAGHLRATGMGAEPGRTSTGREETARKLNGDLFPISLKITMRPRAHGPAFTGWWRT
jgi:PAS domain S-box-containing protein